VENFVTGDVTATESKPCTPNALKFFMDSQWNELSLPEITMTGTESIWALTIPVTAFEVPAPVVTNDTPGFPEVLE
jgi:hypothetical protein